ncbi:MAG: 2-C-methyl-D-erythritol 4-phosphate cytidylyltransferase [Chloroflexi bacterium]|nr:2-C-methyl-D-erythritol 4-phosphate cytidylyltransferase [Chloroflexota bacterium]
MPASDARRTARSGSEVHVGADTHGHLVAGIILAAGASTRMGAGKLWLDLHGLPVIAWSIRTFAESGLIGQLIVVAATEAESRMRRLLEDLAIPTAVVAGGKRRRDSVRAGVEAAASAEWVVVHDGARPLVTPDLIARGVAAAQETGAAVAAVPIVDTIKRVRNDVVAETLDREGLWATQTPQVYRRALLLRAHQRTDADATDDASLVEGLGTSVRVYSGAYGNIKITTPGDMELASKLIASMLAKQEMVPPELQSTRARERAR